MAKNDAEAKKYELVQVPTNHTLAVKTPSEEVITVEEAQVLILNLLTELNTKL